MLKRLFPVLFLAGVGLFYIPTLSAGPPLQDDLAAFKDNSCVKCHSRELSTSTTSNKYLEWHISVHMQEGIGCDKCHGGNPATDNKGKSHEGMLPAKEASSKVAAANLPATCGTCHSANAQSFTKSVHFQKLKDSGKAPSCNTCHEHMASGLLTLPADVSAKCADCHTAGSDNPAAAAHADVPAKAEAQVASIERAKGMLIWAKGLLDAAKDKKLNVAAEQKDFDAVNATFEEAVANWHSFSFAGVTEKADEAFARGTKVKDALRKKMGFQ